MKRQPPDDFPLPRTDSAPTRTTWQPAADIHRCDYGWLVKFDLAGVHKEDIDVTAVGQEVVVSGTRRDWRVEGRSETHLMEIAYSCFERRIELPGSIAASEVRIEYRDGMLLVHVMAKQNTDR